MGQQRPSEPRLLAWQNATAPGAVTNDACRALGDGGVAGSGDVLATLHDTAHLAGGFVDHALCRCLCFVTHAGHHVVHALLEFVHSLLHVVATRAHTLCGDHADTDCDVGGVASNFGDRSKVLAKVDAGEIERCEGVVELKFWHVVTVTTSANFCKHSACDGVWHASSVGWGRRDDPC